MADSPERLTCVSLWDTRQVCFLTRITMTVSPLQGGGPAGFLQPLVEQQSPIFLAPEASFMEDSFSTDQSGGDGSGVTQGHCIYCALYFCCYYISSTSDHWVLDLGGWGPLLDPNFWHSY